MEAGTFVIHTGKSNRRDSMFYRALIAAGATVAITVAVPAMAQRGGGSGGPPPGAGAAAGMNSQGPTNASPTGIMNASPNSVLNRAPTTTVPTTTTDVSTNSQATLHSQGPANASPTGISHANSNSVLARGAVSSSTLSGLATNMTVNNSGGTQIGTISQIITGPNNTIRAVVVTSSTGQTFTLPANSLTISGGVVTTTSTTGG
jgi:hypothetical protein